MIEVVSAYTLVAISLCFWVLFSKLSIRYWWSPYSFLSILTLNIFIIRPLLLLLGLDIPYPDYLFSDVYADVIRAQVYVVIWLVSLIAFYLLYSQRRSESYFSRVLPDVVANIDMTRLRWVAYSLVAISVVVGFATLLKFGSYSAVLIAAKIDKELAGSAFIRQIPGISMFVCAVYLSESMRLKRYFDMALSVLLLFTVVAIYYMWGAREAIAIVFLGFVILLSVKSDSIGGVARLSGVRLLIGAVLLLVISTYAYLGRLESLGASEDAINSRDLITTVCISFHMTRYDAFMLLVRDWDFWNQLRFGYDILIGNLSAVPRFLWESKPEQVLPGAWFRQLYEPYAINGWPFSVLGEWVISFSYLGPILGAWLAIYIYSSLDGRFSGSQSIFGFYFLLFFCLTVVQNGSVLQFVPEYILWVMPMVVIGRFIRKREAVYAV